MKKRVLNRCLVRLGRENGLTLLEMLLVAALLGAILYAGVRLATSMTTFVQRAPARQRAQMEMRVCMEAIERSLSNGKAATLVIATPPTTPTIQFSSATFQSQDGSLTTIYWSNSPVNSVHLQRIPPGGTASDSVLATHVTTLVFGAAANDPGIVSVAIRMTVPLDSRGSPDSFYTILLPPPDDPDDPVMARAPSDGKSGSKESGQILLLAITIGLVLLIAVTVVVLLNQAGGHHQTARSQGAKSQSVAEEGLAYAIQKLSVSAATWNSALRGSFPADCNSGNALVTASGNDFKLYCSTGTAGLIPLQAYQMAVTVVALASGHTNEPERPYRAIRAILSQRTLGADLANHIHAAAALQLFRQPSISASGALTVHWGPIVCLDSAQDATNNPSVWTLPAPIDAGQYPRKFSVGGITGATLVRAGATPGSSADSDQKEYWAYAPMTPPPLIDETSYISSARNTSKFITMPISKASGSPIAASFCPVGIACGYFQPTPGDTAIFGAGYTLSGGPVIYVNGSAEFDQITMDSATFIVTGALSINDNSGGHSISTLIVPATASLEYPYAPASQPCAGQQTCSSTDVFGLPGNVQFRGFLYVKGNLFVNTAGWTMVGALMVGDVLAAAGTSGTLVIPGPADAGNASLNLAYDDAINHDILVNPISLSGAIKVEPERIQDVPAF